MITWIKPSGLEININDDQANTEYAESLGWKRKDEKKEIKDMLADDLKAIINGIDGVKYTNKEDAIAYLEANPQD